MPVDDTCDDCGGQTFEMASDPSEFEKQLNIYKQ